MHECRKGRSCGRAPLNDTADLAESHRVFNPAQRWLGSLVAQLAAMQQGGANQPWGHGHHSCRFRDCDRVKLAEIEEPFCVNAKVVSAGAAVSPGNDDPGVYVPVMSPTSHLPSRAVWSRELQQRSESRGWRLKNLPRWR